MASEVGSSQSDFSRRRSSGGLRRNASHDISDQISENKLGDLKKVCHIKPVGVYQHILKCKILNLDPLIFIPDFLESNF